MKYTWSLLLIVWVLKLTAQENIDDITFAKEFAKRFEKDGGSVDSLSRGNRFFLMQARYIVDSIHSTIGKSPRPYVGLIDNLGFNAKALQSGDKFFIGIYKGTLEVLADVYFELMANKYALQDIGNSSKEATHGKIDLMELYSIRQRSADQVNLPAPVDTIRRMYAMNLLYLANEYLVMHEYGHILHGHCGYFNSLTRIPFAESIDKKDVDPLTALDHQTLEMDADSYATNVTLRELFRCVNDPNLLPIEVRFFYNDWRIAFRSWATALYIQAKLFSFKNDSTKIEKENHLLPAIRMRLILGNVFSVCEYNNFGTSEELGKIIRGVISDVDSAFAQISTEGADTPFLKFMYSGPVSKQRIRIMENWNPLRSKLLKYAFNRIADPFVND